MVCGYVIMALTIIYSISQAGGDDLWWQYTWEPWSVQAHTVSLPRTKIHGWFANLVILKCVYEEMG